MTNSKQFINGSTLTADIIISPDEPTTPFPCMIWSDLTAGLIKVRNLANNGWEIIGTIVGSNFYQPTIDAGFNSVQGILGLKLGTWGSASFSITESTAIYLTGHAAKDIEITPHAGNTVKINGNDIASIMSALSTLASGYTGTLIVVTDVTLSEGTLTKTTKTLTFSGGRLQSIT